MTDVFHILVVDDNEDIREPLMKYLIKNGLRVTGAQDASQARKLLTQQAIDLVVLDVMMPGEDGLSLCRYLREQGEVPVILLTALSDETDRVVGLEVGADDYVTKPFNPRELLARIKAVLRRVHALPPQTQTSPSKEVAFDNWVLDVNRRELIGGDGVAVALSTAEYDMLRIFLSHPNIVLSRDQLLDLTRGRDAVPFDRSIDNMISRLRKKIEADPKKPVLIKTVWGGGYMLSCDVEER